GLRRILSTHQLTVRKVGSDLLLFCYPSTQNKADAVAPCSILLPWTACRSNSVLLNPSLCDKEQHRCQGPTNPTPLIQPRRARNSASRSSSLALLLRRMRAASIIPRVQTCSGSSKPLG